MRSASPTQQMQMTTKMQKKLQIMTPRRKKKAAKIAAKDMAEEVIEEVEAELAKKAAGSKEKNSRSGKASRPVVGDEDELDLAQAGSNMEDLETRMSEMSDVNFDGLMVSEVPKRHT